MTFQDDRLRSIVFLTSSSFLPVGAVSRESFLRDRAITSGVDVQDVDDEDQVAVDGGDLEVDDEVLQVEVGGEGEDLDVGGEDQVDKDLDVVVEGSPSIFSRYFSVTFSRE